MYIFSNSILSSISGLLLYTAKPLRLTQSVGLKVFEKRGGRKQAIKDFYALKPTDVTKERVCLFFFFLLLFFFVVVVFLPGILYKST